MTQPRIQFTQVTANNCQMTKTFKRDENGHLQSSAIAHMTEGHAKIVEIADLNDLGSVLPLLLPNQAITCGVPIVGDTPLTTRAGADFRRDAVARTNEAFSFPFGAALFPIDVDVDGDTFQSAHAVLDALEACSPWLRQVMRVARPSSSSFVAERGLRGVHVYVVVSRGTDIPALAKRMQIEQWAAGNGSIKISKSGALLTRQLSDALVYQPSRLMFEAEPVLEPGTVRKIPADQAFVQRAPQVIGAPAKCRTPEGWIDVQELSPVRDIDTRRFETAVRTAKNARRREAKRIAIDYQRANAIAAGETPEAGERYGLLATRALGDKALPRSWQLVVRMPDGKQIRATVGDILASLDVTLGLHCADPFDTWRPDLEPKHLTKAEIVRMGDTVGVWSHKLQEFFAFTDSEAADLASPLDMAAEKLCGLVEYPEPVGKKAAPFVNVKFGLELLLRDIDALPRFNDSVGYAETDCVPDVGVLVDALSRIGCANVTPGVIERALEAIATTNHYDPWKDAVLALPVWDKVGRLDTFWTDLCGALPTDSLVLTGQLLFSAIIMRQLEPGITSPVVPVLIGAQGTGKSRFISALAKCLGAPPPSSIAFTEPRKMSMAAARSIVAELAEMSGMGRKDVEEVKQWVTDDIDRYRRPYEKQELEHLRRFVLIGSANKHELNRDDTGNRRFEPVHVLHPIDPAWSVECLQILAEARTRFCQTRDDYFKLANAAQAAVYAHNAADMQRGEGTPVSDLDDMLPQILRTNVRMTQNRRIASSAIRSALDIHPTGRQFSAQKIAQWLLSRGWRKGADSGGLRFYEAPDNYLDDDSTSALQSVMNPFTSEATA